MKPQTIMVLSCHTHSLFWFRVDMMKSFCEKGFSVVAVAQESEDEWAEKFAKEGVRYRQLYAERNGTNPFKDLKTLRSIKRIIDEEKPDKIFCYQAKTVIYGCLAAHSRGIDEVYPLIAGLGSVFRGSGTKNALLRLILKTEYKSALKYAKAVIFQNPDDMGCFVEEKIVPREKCRIINGSGVDTEKFIPEEYPKKPAFLMISRLIKDKGVQEYLDACREVKKNHHEVSCMLVGPFDTNPSAVRPEELQAYIDDGSIEYFGEQEDVRPYMNRASVFVLPSYHEGTPKTVLEAMASGRAVITTDAPGCRETVTNGNNGLLIPIKDTDALISAMEYLLRDIPLCVKMGKKGREIAEEKYDVKCVNADIADIMKLKTAEENVHVAL